MSKNKRMPVAPRGSGVNHTSWDDSLRDLLAHLTADDPNGVRVPMPTTVWLLRRLNAVCARNMLRADYHVAEEPKGVRRGKS